MRNRKRPTTILFILLISSILSSCATLVFNKERISFDDLPKITDLTEIPKSELEKSGLSEQKPIVLRFSKPPKNGKLSYREISKIYTQIDSDSGFSTRFDRKLKQIFKDSAEGVWTIENNSILEGKNNEKIVLNFQMTDRGEITKIISGKGKTSNGEIEFLEWTRTPIFPLEPVKLGDKWQYTEKIKSKISSFLVEKSSETPEELSAISTFHGYVKFKNSLCAVIKTRAFQHKKEKLSTLIKDLNLNISSHASETMYFDLKRGVIVAKIAEVDMFTVSEDESFAGQSKAKTITILDEE